MPKFNTYVTYVSLIPESQTARAAERAEGAWGKAFTRTKRAKMFQLINYSCSRSINWFDMFTHVKEFVYTNHESITDSST